MNQHSKENEVFDQVERIFQVIFSDAQLRIEPTFNMDDIEHWDSLTHMNLINALEEHFSIQFSFDEVMNMENVGDIVAAIVLKSK